MKFIKNIPWWGWVAVGIITLFLVNYASSRALNRSLFNLALDQLREDKTAIVETLKKDQEEKARAIANLQKRVVEIQKQRTAAEMESRRLARLVDEKNNEIIALKKEREAIVIPTDPNALADEFRKRGYKPRVVLPVR